MKSLAFTASSGQYLNRTLGTATDKKKWTLSLWAKKTSNPAAGSVLFSPYSGGAEGNHWIAFGGTDLAQTANTFGIKTGAGGVNVVSASTVTDTSWHHFHVKWDDTQTTASQRIRLFIDNIDVTPASGTWPTQNSTGFDFNANCAHYLGRLGSANQDNFDGLMADVYFIDGQALDPSSFITGSGAGACYAKKYAGTFGTNGFWLSFENATSTTTLGMDDAGGAAGAGAGSNDFTLNSMTTSNSNAAYPPFTDVATANNLATGSPAFTNPTANTGKQCTANNLTTNSPAFTSPTIGQIHNLLANNINTGAIVVTNPVVHQTHILTVNNFETQSPEFVLPELTEGVHLQIEFNDPVILSYYAFASVDPTCAPVLWKLEGLDEDYGDWYTLDVQATESGSFWPPGEVRSYKLWTNRAFKIIRLRILIADSATQFPKINQFQLYRSDPEYRWEIGPPEMRYYWAVHVDKVRLVWFRASAGQAGVDPHLRIITANDMECLFNRWKPAHTRIVFDYSRMGTPGPMSGTP